MISDEQSYENSSDKSPERCDSTHPYNKLTLCCFCAMFLISYRGCNNTRIKFDEQSYENSSDKSPERCDSTHPYTNNTSYEKFNLLEIVVLRFVFWTELPARGRDPVNEFHWTVLPNQSIEETRETSFQKAFLTNPTHMPQCCHDFFAFLVEKPANLPHLI